MWLIIQTDPHKEADIASQLERMGYATWHPVQIKMIRSGASRRWTHAKQPLKQKLFPILPRTLFSQAPEQIALGLTGVAVQRDCDNLAYMVPDSQINAFRLAVDQLNKHVLAMQSLAEQRKARRAWKSLQDGLKELLNQSTQDMVEAA